MFKPIYNNPNRRNYEVNGEVNTMPSMTIPGQVQPIDKMLEKWTNGLPMETSRAQIWPDEDQTEPNPVFKDLTDIDLARNRVLGLRLQVQAKMQAWAEKNKKPDNVTVTTTTVQAVEQAEQK